MKMILKSAIILSGLILLLSSCMMMDPEHLAGNHHQSGNSAIYTDVVCGRPVDITIDSLSYQYNNEVYYFHSEECLTAFSQSPDKYVNNTREMKKHHNHQGMMWGLGAVGMAGMMLLMFL